MSDDLLPWLRATISTTRELAQAVADETEARWSPGSEHLGELVTTVEYGNPVAVGPYHSMSWELRRHIAAHDPAAVLTQCEAHTALLDAHPCLADEGDGTSTCGVCVKPGGIRNDWPEEWRVEDWPCPSVRALALAYQHCPGYRSEWKP